MRPGETLIEMARRHVTEGEAHVRKQHEIIERLRADELPTSAAQQLLAEFEQALEDHRGHLLRFEDEQRAGLRDQAGNLIASGLSRRGGEANAD